MKKLVLLGDSIRLIGYGERVAQLLKEEYSTWQPEDNCRFAQYLLRLLFDCRQQLEGADVIHWNCGLWDICQLYPDGEPFTPLDVYLATLKRIAAVLKNYAPVVIFSTSTPCPRDNPYNDDAVICRYNTAAKQLLEQEGVIVNDLYAVIAEDVPRFIRSDDHVHLTQAGIEAAAASVAAAIRAH